VSAADAKPVRFVALRNKYSRPYLFAAGLSMLGDNNEHVISYWVLWAKFHSPLLVGFEVISHWLPFLLLSVYFGTLAERYDCRKLMQLGQAIFILVQLGWGVLFLTGSLQMWEACVLLIMHGMAGAIWGPAEQMMLHDFVENERDLPGVVRMNATFKSIGILFGPAVGSALLLILGPTLGIFVNALFFVPTTILMMRTPFTGHTRSGVQHTERVTLWAAFGALKSLRSNRHLIGMITIAGLIAITIGGAMQVAMPSMATRLGAGSAGLAYGVLLFANGIGAVVGGFVLEATGVLRPSLRTAMICTALYGAFALVFALSTNYVLAVIALALSGFASIAATSIAQSVVQLEAPADQRGRIFGIYGTFSSGLMVGNGITLGGLGAIMGIPMALALCAGALVAGTGVTALYAGRRTTSLPAAE
jgi:MFS family permease